MCFKKTKAKVKSSCVKKSDLVSVFQLLDLLVNTEQNHIILSKLNKLSLSLNSSIRKCFVLTE